MMAPATGSLWRRRQEAQRQQEVPGQHHPQVRSCMDASLQPQHTMPINRSTDHPSNTPPPQPIHNTSVSFHNRREEEAECWRAHGVQKRMEQRDSGRKKRPRSRSRSRSRDGDREEEKAGSGGGDGHVPLPPPPAPRVVAGGGSRKEKVVGAGGVDRWERGVALSPARGGAAGQSTALAGVAAAPSLCSSSSSCSSESEDARERKKKRKKKEKKGRKEAKKKCKKRQRKK